MNRQTSSSWPAVFSLLLGLASAPVLAEDVTYQVKASYIYNILQFADFPVSLLKENQVSVCILGENRFGRALNEIQGASARSGRIEVRRLGAFSSEMPLAQCNVLYIVESERQSIDRIMAKVDQKKVLTIGESGNFLNEGGLIALYEEDEAIRLKINATLVGTTDFKLDAQLVELGVTIPAPEVLFHPLIHQRFLTASL